MPIYATKCKKCGHETDLILRINEELPVCQQRKLIDGDPNNFDSATDVTFEVCHGELEKVPSASNFSFKGGAPTPRFY